MGHEQTVGVKNPQHMSLAVINCVHMKHFNLIDPKRLGRKAYVVPNCEQLGEKTKMLPTSSIVLMMTIMEL